MLLRRIGNKRGIADDVVKHFPAHEIYIDMFFGAGGIFFNKRRATYNICNDIDDDVFNLYTVLETQGAELIEAIKIMPVTDSLFQYWRRNKESDPVRKALRFLFLSNFGYMGQPVSLRFYTCHSKKTLLKNAKKTLESLGDTKFMCEDFRRVLGKIGWLRNGAKGGAFIYADPPYFDCGNNYADSFTAADVADLFDVLTGSGIRFAMSEFDNPTVLELAARHGLEVVEIGERRTLENRRKEILILNYQSPALNTLFSGAARGIENATV